MKKQILFSLFTLALLLLFTASQALAHAAIVWAYVEGDRVYVEAFFANGSKIQQARVVVVNAKEEILLEGRTDSQGKFSYLPPNTEAQVVVVMAGEAHLGDFELAADDLAGVAVKNE